jgi:hypothetical protein
MSNRRKEMPPCFVERSVRTRQKCRRNSSRPSGR